VPHRGAVGLACGLLRANGRSAQAEPAECHGSRAEVQCFRPKANAGVQVAGARLASAHSLLIPLIEASSGRSNAICAISTPPMR